MPLSSHVFLPGKLTEKFDDVPQRITADRGTDLCLFGNPLLLPEGHDRPDFDVMQSLKPIQRATNAGFVVTTVEHDCLTKGPFEEIVGWAKPSPEFRQVDAELRKYKEYCGYCAVLSGAKSIHYHFIYDTRHLTNAPFNIGYESRLASSAEQSAIMHGAHTIYWDRSVELMGVHLPLQLAPDLACRSYTQFKRTPWGIRKLDKHSDILELPSGTIVPQLVLAENIRIGRSPKGSDTYLVSPDFSIRAQSTRLRSQVPSGPNITDHSGPVLAELRTLCRLEWDRDYPMPMSMDRVNNEWIIKFRNHPADRTPSTIARGSYSTLLFCGGGAPPGEFRLPGDLTAQELGDHLAQQFGLILPATTVATCVASEAQETPLQRHKSRSGMSVIRAHEARTRNSFPIYTSRPVEEVKAEYRDKLAAECAAVRAFGTDVLIVSVEGVGKTHAHFGIMAEEALDTAMSHNDKIRRFFCFACKSLEQATAKAAEYATEHRQAVVIESFWRHYNAACQTVGKTPIEKHEFDEDTSLIEVLDVINSFQPTVFAELERKRRLLWTNQAGEQLFNGATMLFTSHATVMTWQETHLTRIWYHPDFDPTNTNQDLDALRAEFALEKVVFDELEPDEFVHTLTPKIYHHLSSVRSNWRGMPRKAKREAYRKQVERGVIPSSMEFEEYSSLRYLDPSSFEEVKVDFDYAPFGKENAPHSIYRQWHNRSFYLGYRAWPFSPINLTFLTTERWVSEIVSAVYAKQRRKPLMRLDLDNLPGVFPVHIPVSINSSARARDVQELTRAILDSNATAAVIADGLGDLKGDRAKSYLGMKGHNGMSQMDVFSVVTYLAPEVYARLNVMGQWIEAKDPIGQHYLAQISQAVGRNTGFRQKEDTKAVVVASKGLLRLIRGDLERLNSRVILQPSPERFW